MYFSEKYFVYFEAFSKSDVDDKIGRFYFGFEIVECMARGYFLSQ